MTNSRDRRHLPSSRREIVHPLPPTDPDAELINAHPPEVRQCSRREYHSAIDRGEPLTFSYLRPPEIEKVHAGTSREAASIVLEIRDPFNGGYHRFKPVFTHQFFSMGGYCPTTHAMDEATSVCTGGINTLLDPNSIGNSRHEISVMVRLAPSGRRSCLVLKVNSISRAKNCEEEIRKIEELECQNFCAKKRGIPKKIPVEEHLPEPTTGKGSKRRRVQTQPFHEQLRNVSEDDEEDQSANRGGSRFIFGLRSKSKRGLFTVDESEESHSSDENCCGNHHHTDSERHGRVYETAPSRKNSDSSYFENGACQYCAKLPTSSNVTPKHTRNTSSRSNDSLQSSLSTGSTHFDEGKMTAKTIVKNLSRGLPSVESITFLEDGHCVGAYKNFKSLSATNESMKSIDCDFLDEPVGAVVREYRKTRIDMTLKVSGGIKLPPRSITRPTDIPFVLSLADMMTDINARVYHDQVEKLAPWWIETADCVEMCSNDGKSKYGGSWKALYLFEKHQTTSSIEPKRGPGRPPKKSTQTRIDNVSSKYSLAGYLTFEVRDKRLLVCQVLILPPYQRSGHGTELMNTVYDLANGQCSLEIPESVSQIDVLLPAPSFEALRNQIDLKLIREVMKSSHMPNHFPHPKMTIDRSVQLLLIEIATKLKITQRQAQISYEIWLLDEIERFVASEVASPKSTSALNRKIVKIETFYKSIVKQSMLQVVSQDKKMLSLSSDEKGEYLETCFINILGRYRSVIGMKRND